MPIVKSLLLVAIVLMLGLVGLAVLVLDSEPVLPGQADVSAVNLAELQFLSAGNDPRRLDAGETGTLMLGEQDLDLLLGYAAGYLNQGRGTVSLDAAKARVVASVQLPIDAMPLYLNVSTTLSDGQQWPRIETLRVGSLTIPDWMQNLVLSQGQSYLQSRYPEVDQLLASVQDITLSEQRLLVSYVWDPQLMMKVSRRGSQWLIPDEMRQRLQVYASKLEELTQASEGQRRVSAATFLVPMFTLALGRGGDHVAENQALLLALSLYAMRVDPGQILDHVDAINLPGVQRTLQLYRRTDFAQHFFSSIGLTLSADAGIANNIGLLKELEDARGQGSGFSFTDIGADRAGMRFAEFAVSNPESALLLQQRMAQSSSEAEFFPNLTSLPEFLSNAEFEARYGGQSSPEFAEEISKIDLLISELAIFRP